MERSFTAGLLGFATLLTAIPSAMAGAPVPAPLVGVTGPFGLLAIGAAYGGYLVYQRFQNRS